MRPSIIVTGKDRATMREPLIFVSTWALWEPCHGSLPVMPPLGIITPPLDEAQKIGVSHASDSIVGFGWCANV